ncbi:MAG: fibrobacter succinogenes major paralogous domain-containing protein [Fibrobacteraceae bacterium]|nr:fibrobacter succinogenes major paralogous domain-containing protein [Fibrobacteraceae bacterium]
MNLKFSILVCICTLSLAFAATDISNIHPGLKSAIDGGNLKLAENLINKVGVRDLYCPASLSPKDAEKLYAEQIQSRNNTLLKCVSENGRAWCSPDFIKAYVEKSCKGTSKQDSLICASWMKETGPDQWAKFEDDICSSVSKIELCKQYMDKVPQNQLYQHLKKLGTKLLVIERNVEKEVEVQEKLSYKECMNAWNDKYPKQKAAIQSKSPYAGTFEFIFGFCTFRGGRDDKKMCLDKLEEAGRLWKKECKSGLTRSVKKKVVEKEKVRPFENDMNRLESYLKNDVSWTELGESWLEQVRFLQKQGSFTKEEDFVSDVKRDYASQGDLKIPWLLKLCKIYPKIDKSVEKSFGFEIFSCDDLIKNKNPMISCNDESDTTKPFALTLSGNKSDTLLCDFNAWRYKRSEEDSLGMCTRKTLGSVATNNLVCDTVWKEKNIANYTCEEGKTVTPKYSGEESYECEKTPKGWVLKKNGNRGIYMDLEKGISSKIFTDNRDGKFYRTIKIGTQEWMAENLNYEATDSYCYKDDADFCTKYGRLYTWSAAMDSAAQFSEAGKGCGDDNTCSPSSTVRGVCPEGWHLPNNTEWDALWTYVGGTESAGKKLKSTSGWYNRGNGTDSYGFAVLPAGRRNRGGSFNDADYSTGFWSSSEDLSYSSYSWIFRYDYSTVGRYTDPKILGFSVRCLKD